MAQTKFSYDQINGGVVSVQDFGAVEFGHSVTSLHQYGRACDYRINHLHLKDDARAIAEDLRVKLGPDFDVVLESDHIHCEYDPKGTRLF